MKFSFAEHLEARKSADILIVPFWDDLKEASESSSLRPQLHKILSSGDFRGKEGETSIVYAEGSKEPRICLLGLGKKEKANPEGLRRAYAEAAKAAQAKKAKHLSLLFPHQDLAAIAEGILLANYSFTQLKGVKENLPVLIQEIQWIGIGKHEEVLTKAKILAEGVYFIRNLINGNADDITPRVLADTALSLQRDFPVLRTKVLDKAQLEEEKMGLLLAVSRASRFDPFLIEVSYKGDPESEELVVLVGKGITYDTGGLRLKTPDGMLGMKSDMAGAATVMGAVRTAAALKLKINVTAVAPVAENAIGSKSYKLGDVYYSASGKTIEVIDTDAEGRLVLADAMTYVQKHLEPSCMIDLATLTGSIVIALGEDIAGLFTENPRLSEELMASSKKSGETLWPMPVYGDYVDTLKSDIADLVNSAGREGGAIKAALFLKEFVKASLPWAHLDIAGPAYISKPKRYNPTKATGFALRLLIDFLEKRAGG